MIAFRKAHDILRLKYRKDVVNCVEMIPCRNSQVVVYRVQKDAQDIFFIFNAGTKEACVTLPEGNWNLMIQDDVAGTDVLGTANDNVIVAPISATVLTLDKA